MSLDIGIGDGVSPAPDRNEPLLQLEDDGYFAFLAPLIGRLHEQTGEYIDPYGDAVFADDKLIALKAELAEAKRQVLSQPATWRVHTRSEISPVFREIHEMVDRSQFLALLESFEQIAARAERLGRPVVCFGD